MKLLTAAWNMLIARQPRQAFAPPLDENELHHS
jgi:hypothetical protein